MANKSLALHGVLVLGFDGLRSSWIVGKNIERQTLHAAEPLFRCYDCLVCDRLDRDNATAIN